MKPLLSNITLLISIIYHKYLVPKHTGYVCKVVRGEMLAASWPFSESGVPRNFRRQGGIVLYRLMYPCTRMLTV